MEINMSKEMTLIVTGFLVCGSDEQIEVPRPKDSLEAAIKLRDKKQAEDEDGMWEIVAEIDA